MYRKYDTSMAKLRIIVQPGANYAPSRRVHQAGVALRIVGVGAGAVVGVAGASAVGMGAVHSWGSVGGCTGEAGRTVPGVEAEGVRRAGRGGRPGCQVGGPDPLGTGAAGCPAAQTGLAAGA